MLSQKINKITGGIILVTFILFYIIIFIEISRHAPFLNTILPALNYSAFPFIAGVFHNKIIFPAVINRNKKAYLLLSPIIISLTITLYFIIDFQLPYSYVNSKNYGYSASEILYEVIMWLLISTLCSSMFFIENWIRNDYIKNELKNEKLQSELNFLKAQINPHFLFNTLHSIYAHAQIGSDKTGSLLEKLSSILRFMVYDCKQDKISLAQEVHAIDDLLDIIKLKDEDEKAITFTHTGVLPNHKIAPLILINIVENLFKHSDINTNKEGFIKVSLKIHDGNICEFKTVNTFRSVKSNQKHSGIGIQNIEKRLNLMYKDQYSLEFDSTENTFTSKLSMPLELE